MRRFIHRNTLENGGDMEIQKMEFAVEANGNRILRIGRSVIYQPPVNYKGKETRWFDDQCLIRKNDTGKWQ